MHGAETGFNRARANKRSPDLLWLEFDGGHAGGVGGEDVEERVAEDEAVFGGDVEEFRGEEEGVGGGFAVGDVFDGDDDGEELADAEEVEGAVNGGAVAAGGDGEGFAGVGEFTGEGDDFGDGLDGVVEFVEKFVLGAGDVVGVEGFAVELVEESDEVAGAAAGVGGEHFPGEVEFGAVVGEGAFPGGVVEAHGGGEGAVAVENVAGEVAGGRELEGRIHHEGAKVRKERKREEKRF